MKTKKYLQLNDINAYKKALSLSNYVWQIVIKWSNLAKFTIGSQLIRAIDSISANTAEGFGRYFKKDKIRFYRMAYGSIFESLDWNEKAFQRKLICKKEYQFILKELKNLFVEVNHLINFTEKKLRK